MSAGTTLAVDVGGTFTDAVVNSPRGVFTGKSPTTPEDQSIGALSAARSALARAGISASDVDVFIQGMTVTTNAMLEGNFARTALLATAGFTDIEEIGRQNRADLYRLAVSRPAPIVPPELRFAVEERCGPDGILRPLDEQSARAAIENALDAGAESLAVCLLFSFRFPAHELRIRELAHEIAPDLHVSLSSEAVGTFREYERCATTTADAALSPLLTGYLKRLAEQSDAIGLPTPQVMLSSGGTVPAETAARNASWTVLSGPAGGAIATARCAERSKARRAIGFDMGGTSTDISLAEGGRVAIASGREIGGRPVALPAVDVSTVGAGGGSIAWRDKGGALRVGPRSAGSRPGPACYGHGGAEPTVTDANLVLGYLSESDELAGGLRLDQQAAKTAVARLGEQLGIGVIETAAGIVEVANLEMLRATSAETVARGIDPRDHALIAFGGAGPMHAAAIAEALEIEQVVCPSGCGVLSAWGISVAGPRRDVTRSVVEPLDQISGERLAAIEQELAKTAAHDLGAGNAATKVTSAYELRYVGQAFELTVEAPRGELEAAFHDAHERRFGFSEPGSQVELVTIRVSVSAEAPSGDDAPAATESIVETSRPAWFGGRQLKTEVLSGGPLPGERVSGPALIQQEQSTIVIPPGWTASSSGGDIVLDRDEEARAK